MIQEFGPVSRVQRIRPAIFSITIEFPAIAHLARPGQFLHLLAPNISSVLLRRPFSIARVKGSHVELLIRLVGAGTEAISRFPRGFICDAIGPLGGVFRLEGVRSALLVGGGIGAAPLLFLQDELKRRRIENLFFLGARARREYPLADKLVLQRQIIPTTDDGSYGIAGFVSMALENWLKSEDGNHFHVFSCGPVAMMKAVNQICAKYHLPHQVSLENRMACGIGVCQGCALPLKHGFKLVCKDGPVFDAREIDWSRLR